MRVIVITLTTFALLIGAYSYWWNSLADLALAQVESWKVRQKDSGYVITTTQPAISGFPYRIKLDINKIVIENPSRFESYSATVHDVWAVVQPWKVNHTIFGVETPAQLSWMNNGVAKTATVGADKALGSATFNSEGNLQNLAIDLTNIAVTGLINGPGRADRVQIHRRPVLAPTTTTNAPQKGALLSNQYALTVDNLYLGDKKEFPLGDTVKKISVLAQLEGSVRDFRNKESVIQWRDNGGIIDIEEAVFIWGDSKISGNGTLALDDKNRPMGAFSTKLVGFNSLLDILAHSSGLDPKAQKTASFALNLLAKQDSNGTRFLEIPISLQEGGLYLGPLFLMPVKPVL